MKVFSIFVIFALKLIFLYYLNAIIALDLSFAQWHYIHRAIFGLLILVETSKFTTAIINITQLKIMEESNV